MKGMHAMHGIRLRTAAALLVLAPVVARAHHVVDFVVTSERADGGRLLVSYDFRSVVPVGFDFRLGDNAIYSGTNPGFDTADGDEFFPGTNVPYPIFPPGIPIRVQLIDNDGGRTAMKVGGVTLAQPGDDALVGVSGAAPPGDLHRHPEWQTLFTTPPGRFGEARIAFRVWTDAPGYEPSPIYSLVLTNGHLPAPEFAGDRYDRDSVRCQQAVGAATAPFVAVLSAGLRRCLDRVQVVRARQAAAIDDTRAFAAAGKACDDRLVARVERAQAKARARLVQRCGEGGSADFAETTIDQHLGLLRCRTEGMLAASYFRARTYLRLFAASDGRALADHFPCVVQTAGEEEGPS
ncbi:MAG: hypothetical protein KIT14_12370 [bacterium]|nr:hypothetical protein [bacterium]